MILDVEGPWTPEKLDGVSQRATERQELLSKDWPAGTVCPERTAARRRCSSARATSDDAPWASRRSDSSKVSMARLIWA